MLAKRSAQERRLRSRTTHLSVAAILLIAATARAQNLGPTQIIPLRSGTSGDNVLDARVVLAASEDRSDFTVGGTAVPAALTGGFADEYARITRDPLARWIQRPTESSTPESSGEFAIAFTVNVGDVSYADVGYMAGYDGVLAGSAAGELRLNGHVIGAVERSTGSVLDAPTYTDDVALLLHTGINWLSISGAPVELGARVVFSAQVNIWRPVAATSTPVETDIARTPGVDVASANTAGNLCPGFTCRVRGDLDSNHFIDLLDHISFADCISGANTALAEDCEYADLDCDGDVDLFDAGLFQAAFTGSS